MCEPTTIAYAAVAIIAAIGAYSADKNANAAAKRQTKAIEAQNQVQANQLSEEKGVELDARARAARRERAAARVSASESGINLGSGSFLAMLQTSEVNESIDSGLILKNNQNQQDARQTKTNSLLSGITTKTGVGIALDTTEAGVSAYYGAGGKSYLGSQPGRG